jgi:hypothetical protein
MRMYRLINLEDGKYATMILFGQYPGYEYQSNNFAVIKHDFLPLVPARFIPKAKFYRKKAIINKNKRLTIRVLS